MATDVAAMVERYFALVNDEDWVGLRQIWHADGSWKAVGARRRTGVDDVIGYFERLFTPWAVHSDTPSRILVSDESATVEVAFVGTTHEGLEVAFDAVDIFDFKDGLITRMSNWYDLVYVREMLAAAAAAAAAPAQGGAGGVSAPPAA